MPKPPFRKLLTLGFGLGALLCAATAFADPPSFHGASPFGATSDRVDLAQAWIGYLFHGDVLPDTMAPTAAPLASVAEGLREALGLYSIWMLLMAAMVVFYHIASMVAETAHYGVVFGRRANQIWMPLRFVFALGLLIPIGTSLSTGQYLVIKLAEMGSTLATNAWRSVAEAADGHLSGLVPPRGPGAAQFAAAAIDMEGCRIIYQELYPHFANDDAIKLAGNIPGLNKIPGNHFNAETWRYSNVLNANVPLCGEYRFSGYRQGPTNAPTDISGALADKLSAFAHSETDTTIGAAQLAAGSATPTFIGGDDSSPDIRSDVSSLVNGIATQMEGARREMSAGGAELAAQALTDSTSAGWIASASFILDIVRLEESYGEAVGHALPDAQSPVFAHPAAARAILGETIDALLPLHPLEQVEINHLIEFYAEVGHSVARMHNWLYTTQFGDRDFVAMSSADLRDRLNAGTESAAAMSLFARAADASAQTRGVWGEDPGTMDAGSPFTLVPPDMPYNPFAALVEFGRRQVALAGDLSGLAGSGISVPGATGPSVLLGIASFLFFAGGLLLMFVVPLLPFLRFLMAALTWALNVFEAVIAVPVVALAHLTPGGDGLSGGVARQGYLLILALMIRPLLTLAGLVLGLLLFTLGITFLNAVLMPFARVALPSNGGMLVMTNTGLVLMYDILIYAAANASFKGIHWLPDKALRWISRFVVSDSGDAPAPQAVPSGPGPIGFGAISNFFGSGIAPAASVNVTGATGGTPQKSDALKQALFPAYKEPSGTGYDPTGTGSVQSAPPGISANQPYTGSSPTNVNVNLSNTTNVSTTVQGGGRGRDDRKPVYRDKHDSTMGGKERGTPAEKTDGGDSPKGSGDKGE